MIPCRNINMQATIEKMIYGGYGLARTANGVVFVPDAIPGETVEISEGKKKNGFTVADLLTVINQSPARRKPVCAFAGICGGCDWLHIDYKMQLLFKKEIFIDSLLRTGRVKIPAESIELYESPEYNYRRRAQIKIDQSAPPGFYKKKSNEIVPLSSCPLLVESINQLLGKLNKAGSYPNVKSLKVIAGDETCASSPVVENLTGEKTTISVGKYSFIVYGESFFQSNVFLPEKLGSWAASDLTGDLFLDLYGGTGFFSAFLSGKFSSGYLIESMGDQVEQAIRNFSLNGIKNVTAIHCQAEEVGKKREFQNADLLLVDPPRPGLTRRARETVAALKPQKLLYISCNPSTQARDAGFFVKECGFQITKAAVFDMYPNTYHLETALLFER